MAWLSSSVKGVAEAEKRSKGCYYTLGNPFRLEPFGIWAEEAQLSSRSLVEPFAGAAHLLEALEEAGYFSPRVSAYDLYPQHRDVQKRDALLDFPLGYEVCVTNPP